MLGLLLQWFALTALFLGTVGFFFLGVQRSPRQAMPPYKPLLAGANVLCGLAVVISLFLPIPLVHKGVLLLWKIVFGLASLYNWKKRFLIPAVYWWAAWTGLGLCYLLSVDFGWTKGWIHG